MKKFIRSIFRQAPFENILVFLLGKFPNRFLRALTSQNYTYPAKSMRTCTRFGIQYELDISDYQNWLIYFYSDSDSSFGLLNYIKKSVVIFDVGGNIGQTALMLAQKNGSHGLVYSFEPFPDTYKKFQKNLSLNPALAPSVSLQNIALGAVPDELNMYQDCDTNSGANRMVPGNDDQLSVVKVPVTTIDIFISENKIAKVEFIKIDVEGFEMKVLEGASATLSNLQPDLFIELDDQNLRAQGSSATALCQYLQGYSYTIFEEGKNVPFDCNNYSSSLNIYCTVNQ